jgi:hypothetical protein
MAKLILSGATSGSISIESPAVSGTNTLTLPANTGTVITTGSTFAGTGPAFSAYRSGNQTLSSNTNTKIQYNAENFDTNNNFDSTTNYRFTPTVAGYYQINYQVGVSTSACTMTISVIKNGDTNAGGGFWVNTSAVRGTGSNVIYFNGSTDYLEIYTNISSGQTLDSANTYFSGFLARSA